MQQTIASEIIAAETDNPVSELEDFDAVVKLYWPRVFRFVFTSLRDRDAAENLTQDCFMRAFKGRASFRGDCSVNTWLMRIAVNLVRDFVRSRRLQFWRKAWAVTIDPQDLGHALADRGLSPEAQALLVEELEAVWAVTAKLPERQRTVFLLRFVEDLDLLEIARATGLSEGAVKVHLFRAVHAVRERIGKVR